VTTAPARPDAGPTPPASSAPASSAPSSSVPGPRPVRRSIRTRMLWLLVCVLVLLGLVIASVAFGARQVSAGDILGALTGPPEGIAQAAVAKRLPRTVLALVAGAALGVSGCLMQGVTRNPLADPGILGINTGATLAVVIGMASVGVGAGAGDGRATVWLAIAGSAVTAVGVYLMGSLGQGGPTPLKLALAGAATSAALGSLVTAVVLPRGDIAESARSWQIGGVGGATWSALQQIWPFLLVGLVLALVTARGLDSLALGDEVAAGLGEHVMAIRLLASLGAVLLCGATTAVCGPIGFVGLVIPHACRLLVGTGHRWLLVFSAVVGAGLLLASDVLGRVVARPGEVDVGIITALVGAPFFIAIVRRQRVRAL
jgi:iron complex transport system permease protein